MSTQAPKQHASESDPASRHEPNPKYNAWERNVIDDYKSLSNEEIRSKVEANRLPLAVLMTHINIDYNLSAVLRIGNCFGAKVFYYGTKRWDKRGALGVWHYSPITYLSSLDEVKALQKEYNFVALEQTERSVELPKFKWPEKPLILLGEESRGLQETPDILCLAEQCVVIPQRGSVRSLNAASAFAVAAYDYSCKLLYNV